MENPYEVLGVSRNATQDEIKKAYRKKSFDNHPDVNTEDDEDFMADITVAYKQIGDARNRAVFDLGYAGLSFDEIVQVEIANVYIQAVEKGEYIDTDDFYSRVKTLLSETIIPEFTDQLMSIGKQRHKLKQAGHRDEPDFIQIAIKNRLDYLDKQAARTELLLNATDKVKEYFESRSRRVHYVGTPDEIFYSSNEASSAPDSIREGW